MRAAVVLLSVIYVVSACAPTPPDSSTAALFVYRTAPPTILELDGAWRVVREIPFAIPEGCDLGGMHPAPHGPNLAIELNCAFGPAVLWLDARSGSLQQPIVDSDSHYLAWAADGRSMYLKVDSINRPRVVRFGLNGEQDALSIDGLTYDLAPSPSGEELVFSVSRGMGRGSEMWKSRNNGASAQQLASDDSNYMALATWSPDSTRLAFIKIPDSPTPFSLGELWVMHADGSDAQRLAAADAGHGFAPAWSPDGTRIAFVRRENPGDAFADVSSAALISNLDLVDMQSGGVRHITEFKGARIEAPVWQPHDGIVLFNARVDDRMAVYVLNLMTGSVQSIPIASICCAVWIEE